MSVLTNDQLNENIVRLEGRFDRVEEMLEALTHAFEGNGRPGFKENLIRLDQRVQALEQLGRDHAVPRAVWIPLVLSSVLSLGSLLAAVLHH